MGFYSQDFLSDHAAYLAQQAQQEEISVEKWRRDAAEQNQQNQQHEQQEPSQRTNEPDDQREPRRPEEEHAPDQHDTPPPSAPLPPTRPPGPGRPPQAPPAPYSPRPQVTEPISWSPPATPAENTQPESQRARQSGFSKLRDRLRPRHLWGGAVAQVQKVWPEGLGKSKTPALAEFVPITQNQQWPRVEYERSESPEKFQYFDAPEASLDIYGFARVELAKQNPSGKDALHVLRAAIASDKVRQQEYNDLRSLVQERVAQYLGFSTYAEVVAHLHERTNTVLDAIIDPLIFFQAPGMKGEIGIPPELMQGMYDSVTLLERTQQGTRLGKIELSFHRNQAKSLTQKLTTWYDRDILQVPQYVLKDGGDVRWSLSPQVAVPTRTGVRSADSAPTGADVKVAQGEEHNIITGTNADIVYAQPQERLDLRGKERFTSRVIANAEVGLMGVFYDTSTKGQEATRAAYSRIKSPAHTLRDAQEDLRLAARTARKEGVGKRSYCVVEVIHPHAAGGVSSHETQRAVIAERRERMQAYKLDRFGHLESLFANVALAKDLSDGRLSPEQAVKVQETLASAISDTDIWEVMMDNVRMNLQNEAKKEEMIRRLSAMKYPLATPLSSDQQQRLASLEVMKQAATREVQEAQARGRLELAIEQFQVIERTIEDAIREDVFKRQNNTEPRALHGKGLPLSRVERDLMYALMDEHIAKLPEYVKAQRQGSKKWQSEVVAAEQGDVVVLAPSEIPPGRIQQAIAESAARSADNKADMQEVARMLRSEYKLPVQVAVMSIH